MHHVSRSHTESGESRGVKTPFPSRRTSGQDSRASRSDRRRTFLRLLRQWKLQLLCILLGFFLFFLSVFWMQSPKNLKHGRFLRRQYYGGETSHYELEVEGLSSTPFTIDVPVSPRSYKEEEIEAVFEECMNKLSLLILKDNPSLSEIRSDLFLPSYLEAYGLYISWSSSDPELLGSYGDVRNEDLTQPVPLCLTACLYDSSGRFQKNYELPITIHPRTLTTEETQKDALSRRLQQIDREQMFDEELTLPDEFQGIPLTYREHADHPSWIFLLLGLVSALLLTLREKQNSGKLEKLRQRQMLLDYPEIVSKLTVFIGTGMTIRLALAGIVRDYEDDRLQNPDSFEVHYAYEALTHALAKLKTGSNEGKVYHEFGRDCKLRPYMKLAGILEQNRRNGIANIRAILNAEMAQAWEERKNLARRLGEEAGTKLLGPLFIMLIIVMVIIIVPAMLSF